MNPLGVEMVPKLLGGLQGFDFVGPPSLCSLGCETVCVLPLGDILDLLPLR